MPDSGTGITMSACTGAWRASSSPILWRAACTLWPYRLVSGREKYTNSNRQSLGEGSAKWCERSPDASMVTISPGSTSRT